MFSLSIVGWAALKVVPSNSTKIKLIFYNDKNIYSLETIRNLRKDVTAWINDGVNYDNAGINSSLSKKDIEKGKYRVGVIVENTRKNKIYYKPFEYTIKVE